MITVIVLFVAIGCEDEYGCLKCQSISIVLEVTGSESALVPDSISLNWSSSRGGQGSLSVNDGNESDGYFSSDPDRFHCFGRPGLYTVTISVPGRQEAVLDSIVVANYEQVECDLAESRFLRIELSKNDSALACTIVKDSSCFYCEK